MWRILDTGKASASHNMEIACNLLSNLSHLRETTFHSFDWDRPALTYGILVKAQDLVDLKAIERFSLDIAQRPTGGGVMFHVEDVSFSLAVPATAPGYSSSPEANYAWVNQAVARAIETCMGYQAATLLQDSIIASDPRSARFCMSAPTRYDILWQGKKVGGAAQRCTRHGFLHQGSIALIATPAEWLQTCIHNPESIQSGMNDHAGSLLHIASPSIIQELRHALRRALQRELAETVAQQHDDLVTM